VPADQTGSAAYQFLRQVQASDAPEAHRFCALRLIARIENARATGSTAVLIEAKRRLLIQLTNSEQPISPLNQQVARGGS
jgi:hypothetical protein